MKYIYIGVSSNEVSVLGYDLIAPTEEIDGTFIWEISGLYLLFILYKLLKT